MLALRTLTPHGYPWAWLREGGSLLQQTESASHADVVEDASLEVARLELVRTVEGRLETRTLLEVSLEQQSLAFEWKEQP